MIRLSAEPLTRNRFAQYGDVIEASPDQRSEMNEARFDRFDELAGIEVGGADVAVSIARCRVTTKLPYCVDVVERHPLGSQAFVPLQACRMLFVVAPPGDAPDAREFRAFVSNGRQGINYRRGTWHMPLIAFEQGHVFLIIDRAGGEPNCDTHSLDESIMIEEI